MSSALAFTANQKAHVQARIILLSTYFRYSLPQCLSRRTWHSAKSADSIVLESFEEQVRVLLGERVPVFSFTFGIPPQDVIQAMKEQGTCVIGTVTTVDEAIRLEAAGVDAVVAQGSEAGGHRGTLLKDAPSSLIGIMALVPQFADHVSIPVIASGGIMDGWGLVASFALGAAALQMGTAFLACTESGTRHSRRFYERHAAVFRHDKK